MDTLSLSLCFRMVMRFIEVPLTALIVMTALLTPVMGTGDGEAVAQPKFPRGYLPKELQPNRQVRLAIMAGFGGGHIEGVATLDDEDFSSYVKEDALSLPHLLLELDYILSSRMELGVFGRVQPLNPASSVGAQLHITALESDSIRLSARVGGGYGYVRHVVPVVIESSETRYGSTLAGPYFYKVGGAFFTKFSEAWSVKVALDFNQLIASNMCPKRSLEQELAPVDCDSSALHLDLSLGVVSTF